MIAQALCPVCNKQSEVLSEKKLTTSVISRKLQCGHSKYAKNYSSQIEKIHERAKKAKFRILDDSIHELQKVIRKMETAGDPNVDSAKELLEELHKPFKEKLPRRKETGGLMKIVRDHGFGDVFQRQLDQNDGELDDENF